RKGNASGLGFGGRSLAVANAVLLSGFDLWAPHLPEDVRLVQPPFPLPGLDDVRQAVLRALEEPEAGEPLGARLRPPWRVTVVLADFCLPVPPLARDCRSEMLETVLQVLYISGIRASRLSILVANGLSRQWRPGELDDFLGSMRSEAVRCHDA